MNKMLKFEFRRLLRSKAFIICLILSALGILVLSLTNRLLAKALGGDFLGTTSLSMLKSIGTNFTLLAAIFVSIFITDDFASDTIKNIYSKGFSRTSVFWSKYVASLAGCAAFLLANGLLQLFLGAALFDGIGTAGKNYALAFIVIILLYLTYHSLYFAISISVRKIGAAIALSFVGPTGVELLLSLADMVLKLKKFSLSDYWIAGRIVPLMEADVSIKAVVAGLIVALAISALSIAIAYFVNRKRDV